MSKQITAHAIQRYIERVEPGCSRGQAIRSISESAERGRCRSTPRKWMRRRPADPGTAFIYDAQRPDVCLLVRGNHVVTIYSRAMFKTSAAIRGRTPSHG